MIASIITGFKLFSGLWLRVLTDQYHEFTTKESFKVRTQSQQTITIDLDLAMQLDILNIKNLIQIPLNKTLIGFKGWSSAKYVILFDECAAAKEVAFMLNGQWDGCNSVSLNKCDEVAINVAASLMAAKWCYGGASSALLMRLTANELLQRYRAGERNFVNANLRCALLNSRNLSAANLSWAKLNGANLSGANLSGADLTVADLSEANLSGADLSQTSLARTNLIRANLNLANLRGANLNRACLKEANLAQADLRGADLSLADLRGANLDQVSLRGACMTGAKLPAGA